MTGVLKVVKYKTLPVPSGGLEVPLVLTFSSRQKWVRDKMKKFIEHFYSFHFTGIQYDTVRDRDSSSEDFEIDLDANNEEEGEKRENESTTKPPDADNELIKKIVDQDDITVINE